MVRYTGVTTLNCCNHGDACGAATPMDLLFRRSHLLFLIKLLNG
ncbi:hypothetical protein [Nostoc flagelliforme]|nr:hypothetical protein [Nostoc flagelliforme]